LTCSIYEALKLLKLDSVVEANIERLIEIRDAAVHLTAHSGALPYLAYSLGAASLRNYCTSCSEWFGLSLSNYNFYILALGFSYPFQSLRLAQVSKEPLSILKILQLVVADQNAGKTQSGNFHLVCEIETHLISAKKVTSQTDISAAIGEKGKDALIVERTVGRLDSYPLSATELRVRLKAAIHGLKQNHIWEAITALKIKGNPKYSIYSYRTKKHELKGPSSGTTVIYNDDAYKVSVLLTPSGHRRRILLD
jgi:hypothetical protein